MNYQLVAILLSLFLAACSSKRKVVESPLFTRTASPETQEELESLPKVSQAQLIEEVSPEPVKPAPQPRTILTANRKAPPPQEIKPVPEAPLRMPTQESENYIVYSANGGERLSFIARSLLGSPAKTNLLEQWNPGISSGPLAKGQEVKVKTADLKPQSIYLSKALLEKYKVELRDHLEEKPQKTYIVKTGDTLQSISQLLYSTTRRWTELYLLNFEKIGNPDILENKTEIKHY
ncbi:MAG: LysM peptidoglycan-binding domain-containing protein [Bdellovibrio sp.]